MVNRKRVVRLYTQAHLQVRRRKCKKVPISERQPLVRPAMANQVWSMGFVFDRGADERRSRSYRELRIGCPRPFLAVAGIRVVGSNALTLGAQFADEADGPGRNVDGDVVADGLLVMFGERGEGHAHQRSASSD